MQDGSLTLFLLGIPGKSIWTDLHCSRATTRGLSPENSPEECTIYYSFNFLLSYFCTCLWQYFVVKKKKKLFH